MNALDVQYTPGRLLEPDELICPGCLGPVVGEPPRGWPASAGRCPEFTHADGSVLCPDSTGLIGEPAEPAEQRFWLTEAAEQALDEPDMAGASEVPAGDAHTVAYPIERAHLAQAEFAQRRPGPWRPYIHRSFDTLPQRVTALIEAGRGRAAEYELLCAERFAEVFTAAQYQRSVTALEHFVIAQLDKSGQVIAP